MSEKEIIEELKEIKKLLVLILISSKVQQGEIAEIFRMDQGNFSKAYPATKLLKRMKAQGGVLGQKKVKKVKH